MSFPLIATLQELCIPLDFIDGNCIVFPGGAEICTQFPRIPTDGGEAIGALFQQINTALAPLTPIFNIIDAVVALFQCVQAIPDAIVKLDVNELVQCVPDMVKKINKLLQLIPQITIPAMIVALIDILIKALIALRTQLQFIALEQAAIIARNIKAAQPGNVALRTILDCAQHDLDVHLQYANARMTPINRLLGVVVVFAQILGINFNNDGIGQVTSIDTINATLIPLDLLIEVLTILRNAIPL